MKHSEPKVWVWVILVKNNKVLMLKRKNSHWDWTWWFTWWHLEYGENFEECAIRETYEEANINLKNVRVVWLTNDLFKKENKHYVTVFTFSDSFEWEFKIMEPDKFTEFWWFDWENMPNPIFKPIENLKKGWFNFKEYTQNFD